MPVSVWYWVFSAIVAILSLSNSALIVTRIIHVSNGRSILDSDAPAGLKLRKWFLMSLGVANSLRLLTTVIEDFYVVWWSLNPSTVWLLRCLPSVFFLLTTSFVTHYLGNLYFSLQGAEGSRFRTVWIALTAIFMLSETSFVLVLSLVPPTTSLVLLHMTFLILALHGLTILASVWYFTITVWRSLSQNQTNVQTSKVLVRMLMLVAAVTLSLVAMTILRTDEYITFTEAREMQVQTAGHWVVLLFGESLSSLLMILVITNAFSAVESRLRSTMTPTSGSSGAGGVAMRRVGEQTTILGATNAMHIVPHYQAVPQQE